MSDSVHILSCFFGWMFLASGGMKLYAYRDFVLHLASFRVAPLRVCQAMALGIPAAEVAVGGLLFAAPSKFYPAIGGLALLAGFTVFVAWALKSGAQAACFCFGKDDQEITSATLYRNLLLVGLMAGLLLMATKEHAPLDAAPQVLGAAYAATALLLFLSAIELISLRQLKVAGS